MSLLTNLDETFSHAEDLNALDKLMSFVDPELLQQAPLIENAATADDRARNRRVEININQGKPMLSKPISVIDAEGGNE